MKISRKLAATLLVAAAPLSFAQAETLAGLTFDQRLVTFDSMNPATVISSTTLTGLTAGDQLIGIDLRPSNNSIYGVATSGRVYVLAPSGFATLVGTLSTTPVGGRFGFDFNPVPDRLRVISDTDQNLRVNVDGGATVVDTPITRSGGGAIDIVGSGYTNSVAGAPAPATTVLYGVDSVSDSLLTSAAPNAGVYSTVGPLNVAFSNNNSVAFDISGLTNTGFLSVDSALYSVNLGNGGATFLGILGSGPLIGLTAVGAVPEPGTWAMLLAGFGIIGGALRRRRRPIAAIA